MKKWPEQQGSSSLHSSSLQDAGQPKTKRQLCVAKPSKTPLMSGRRQMSSKSASYPNWAKRCSLVRHLTSPQNAACASALQLHRPERVGDVRGYSRVRSLNARRRKAHSLSSNSISHVEKRCRSPASITHIMPAGWGLAIGIFSFSLPFYPTRFRPFCRSETAHMTPVPAPQPAAGFSPTSST